MIYRVFDATKENSITTDFVQICEKYLKSLDIELSFSDKEQMGNWQFKNLVKEKVKLAAFSYLIEQQKKQSKILHIQYKSLELQEYLLEGNKNINVSKFIFKARSQTLDIKTQKKWKYDDKACVGCNVREETGEEILNCWYFGKDEQTKPITYDMFYGAISDMIMVANVMMKKLKVRENILDNG